MRFISNAASVQVNNNYLWKHLVRAGIKVPELIICFEDSLNETRLSLVLQDNGISNTTEAIKFFKFLTIADYSNLEKTPKVYIENSNAWIKILVESANMRIIVKSKVVFSEIGLCFQCTNCSALSTGNRTRKPHYYVTYKADAIIRRFGVVQNSTAPEWSTHFVPPRTTTRGMYPNVKTFETASDRDLYELNVGQRSCMFSHERTLRNWPYYYQKLCMIECRANTSRRVCGCVPHFVARPDLGDNVCTVFGLNCVAAHKDFILARKPRDCDCLPDCEKLDYTVSRYIESNGDSDTENNILERETGIFMEPKRSVYVCQRIITFGALQYLVSIGGIAGFFLGASVLSIAEFIHAFMFLPALNWCRRRFSKNT